MEIFTVTAKNTPRMDSFLLEKLPALSIGKLNKYLRENKIKLNGKKQPLATRLKQGDEIRLYLPIENADEAKAPTKNALSIVYEDDALLLVQKPAGLLCEDASDESDTLQNRARCYMQENGKAKSDFAVRLCHRLDAGTSGLVALAKSAEAEALVAQLIKNRKLKKEYLCVTLGIPSPAKGTLRGYLIKDAAEGHVQVREAPCKDGREIITEYRTSSTSGRLALLQVTLVTGRTHQIRAHLASIGCPILGDSKYGNNAMNRAYRMKYQALCAYTLAFPDLSDTVLAGVSGQKFTAEKPWYVEQLLNKTLR